MSDTPDDLQPILDEWREASSSPMDPAAQARARAAVIAAAGAAPGPWRRRITGNLGRRLIPAALAGASAFVVAAGWTAPASSPLHSVRLARENVSLALPGDSAAERLGFAEDRLHQAGIGKSDLSEVADLLRDARAQIAPGSALEPRLLADLALLQQKSADAGVCPGATWCTAGGPVAITPSPTPATHPPTPKPTGHATATAAPTAPPTPRPTAKPTPAPTPVPPPVVLYADEFTSDAVNTAPSGWNANGAEWRVHVDGGNHFVHNGTAGIARLSGGSSTWTNYTVSVNVRVDAGGTMAGIGARWKGPGSYYMCKIWQGRLVLATWKESIYNELSSTPYTPSGWQKLTMTVKGSALSCSVGGLTVTGSDTTLTSGGIAILGEGAMDADAVRVIRS